jgi:transposase
LEPAVGVGREHLAIPGHTRTVSRWIRKGELDRDLDEPVRYKPRPPVPRKLDPCRGIIQAHVEAYPELSSVRLRTD